MTLEELQVIITAKTAGLQSELKNVSKQLKGMETSTQKSMSGMQNSVNKATSGIASAAKKLKTALIVLGIGKVIKDSFNIARTYEASLGQVNRLLGQNSTAFQAWVEKNALTFGLAKSQAMEYASIYGNLLTGFLPNTVAVTNYTQELLKASSIIASNTGRTMKDVNERIRSGLLGNTEAIEDLGVNVNVALLKTTDAFKQLSNGVSWDKLSFQTQQQIRLMGILEQTSKKFGDSVQNNTNFQLMQLTAQLKDIALNIGNAFMPIVNIVLPILNSFAGVLVKITNTLAVFMNALFGTNMKQVTSGSQGAAEGLENVAGGYEEAGKEAEKAGKKAKGVLTSFDEVNTLNLDKDSGGGVDDGSSFDGIQLEDTSPIDQATESLEDRLTKLVDAIKAEMDRLKEIFKEGFNIGIGGDWKERLEELMSFGSRIKEALKNIFDNDVLQAAKNMFDAWVLSAGQTVGAWVSVGLTIATNLIGGIARYLEQNGQFIKDRFIGIFNVGEEIASIWGEWVTSLADIFSVFGGETAQQITADIIAIFSNGFLGVTELALRFGKDILDTITGPIIENKDKIKLALENTLKPIEAIVGTLKDFVTSTFSKIFEAYETYIEPAFENIKDGLSKIVGALLDAYNTHIAPTIDKMATMWSEFYSNTLQPVINKAIDVIGKLGLASSELYKNVLAPFVAWIIDYMAPFIAGAFESISTIFDIVATAIVGQIGNLLDWFGGFIDYISGIFTGDWDKAWQGIKAMFKAIVDSFETLIITPIKKALDWISTSFTRSWKTTWEGCSKIFKGVFDGLVTIAKGPINIIIEAINVLIRGLNKFRIDIPDWVSNIPGLGQYGGQSIGFNIPSIPKLARGGIVDGATFMGNYIAGEAGKEMIVPLENTPFVDKLASALGNAVMMAMQFGNSSSSSDSERELILELDGIEIGRAIIPGLSREIKRTGVRLV